VHRLDRDTSGLLVFARSVAAERQLAQQFRKHATHRRYLAIARGNVAAQTISTNLVRDRGDGRRGSTKLPDVGKQAVTHVKPIERIGDYTLVECRLETGRTHQIRIHLAERGHPLCGEKVYHQPLFGEPMPDTSGAPRLALHAAELGFEHPVTGERLRFQMPLPTDLREWLGRLRREARSAHDSSGLP
jgi:23S rRNA pseudouridine1911/1915/1917 synthase